MRFGNQLRTSLIKDWQWNYIDYDSLKSALKKPHTTAPSTQNPNPPREPWTEDDERHFVKQLEAELDKVFTFQKVKSEEIVRRIRASEREVGDVIGRVKAQEGQGQGEGGQQGEGAEGVEEEDFLLLEEDLSDIIAEVHDLAKFTQLNYTGFQKIIKKHDKQTNWHLKPAFAARLNAKPFFRRNYDEFIVKLSKLYDLVRTRGNPTKGDAAAGGGQQNFVRQTTKYWVHPDNITELKLIILKHLPVLVFNASKEFDPKDSAITSIYYDNTNTWELYEGRLKKTEGAEAIRLRWYGSMETDTIFVERKTHREDWTGEKSVKARFALKEKNVNKFLAGKMTVDEVFAKMRKEGKKSEKEISDLEQLARELQFRVIDRKLVPVTRTFYNRTAFQLPGDARVRISLDTELTMVREDNLDGKQRAGKNWRRMDIGIDYPFSQLPPEDVERFPYAVLEVKLQTQAGQEPPQWIRDLTASHLVEAVPKFSKFIHGTATLQPNRIHLLPFWMPQMDVDIRKPITHRFGIEHPGQSTDISTSGQYEDDSDDEMDEELDGAAYANGQNGGAPDRSPAFNGDESEDMRRLRVAREIMEQHEIDQNLDLSNGDADGTARLPDVEDQLSSRLPGLDADEDYPLYDSDDDEDLEEAKRVGGWYYRRKLLNHYIENAEEGIVNFWRTWFGTSQIPIDGPSMGIQKRGGQMKRFKAPPGKRIHVPVRVEPKVSFAAERTFLSWLEFSIILGSIAATLLNFGDAVSLASAWSFTILAALALIYSAVLYLWRVDKIRKRRAVRYHEGWGPTGLCAGLLVAVGVSFVFRLTKGGEGGLRG